MLVKFADDTKLGRIANTLKQWSPTLGLQIFLDYNSQKPSLPSLLAMISGSWSPKNIWRPKVGDHCSRVLAILFDLVSSADLTSIPCTPSSKSVINILKSIRPRTDPWGIPLVTSSQLEKDPLIITLWVLFCSQLFMHLTLDLSSPHLANQDIMALFVKSFAEVKIYYVYSIPSVYQKGDPIKKMRSNYSDASTYDRNPFQKMRVTWNGHKLKHHFP